jgi:hypothetical protein
LMSRIRRRTPTRYFKFCGGKRDRGHSGMVFMCLTKELQTEAEFIDP